MATTVISTSLLASVFTQPAVGVEVTLPVRIENQAAVFELDQKEYNGLVDFYKS